MKKTDKTTGDGDGGLWADNVSTRPNTIASLDQFKPIRSGENLVVNFKEWYKLVMQCFLCHTIRYPTCQCIFLVYKLAVRWNSFILCETLVPFVVFFVDAVVWFFRSHEMTDIPEAGHKKAESATKKNVGVTFGVLFAVLLIVVFAVVMYKPSRR